MASLVSESSGLRRLDVVCADGKRRKLRLGRVSLKYAEGVRHWVDRLVLASSTGVQDPEAVKWVEGVGDDLRARLVSLALAKPKRSGTVGEVLELYSEHLDVKPVTRLGYKATLSAIRAYFGESSPASSVDALLAQRWRTSMKTAGLAEATISKRIIRARTIWKSAIRWGLCASNPFVGVRAGSQVNKSRERFVTRQEVDAVLSACPDHEWRAIVALSRFGGLRCPSEVLGLKLSDIDFERSRFRVKCTKTEHHQGKDERWVPIFPELLPILLEAHEKAPPGVDRVISRYSGASTNLQTQFIRIVRRVGLTPWPRIFHNMRASRETELARVHPLHVVCYWIGHSPRVAASHYLQVTDHDFSLATVPNPSPSDLVSQNAAHNAAQLASERVGNQCNSLPSIRQNPPELPEDSDRCGSLQDDPVALVGLQPPSNPSEKRGFSDQGGALSGAVALEELAGSVMTPDAERHARPLMTVWSHLTPQQRESLIRQMRTDLGLQPPPNREPRLRGGDRGGLPFSVPRPDG